MRLSLARSCAACVSVTFKVLEGFFFNEHGCIKKIDLESVLQEQNVKSEMVSGKVFQSGPILEPNHAIYTSLLQFQSNDAAPEEA